MIIPGQLSSVRKSNKTLVAIKKKKKIEQALYFCHRFHTCHGFHIQHGVKSTFCVCICIFKNAHSILEFSRN